MSNRGTYRINEIFYSIQGEGVRAGTANVFLRFSGCNLSCRLITHGFDCDTEFTSGTDMDAGTIARRCREAGGACDWLVLTGGEPALQIDADLVGVLRDAGFKLAIETNGTQKLPEGLDWICVSPKTSEHALALRHAHEVKYVRRRGQAIPRPSIVADHYLISPAFTPDGVESTDLNWCLALVKDNPTWRLSIQVHKLLGVR